MRKFAGLLGMLLLLSWNEVWCAQVQPVAHSTGVLRLNASKAAPPVQPADYHGGTNRAPDGQVLGVTDRYLTLAGKPWIPVMGEMHYARVPEADWDVDLAEMKAAGVTVVSTYVIWIYHEEVQGEWDWSGRRNLRRFAQLCQKHGLLLMVRIGPWSHAETRNGGLPDWVVKAGPTRQMAPQFMAETRAFYNQIGEQLDRLLWKDGGPVIGVQIENEYAERGPGKGTAYILALKAMARHAGLDVPLYTVTGWDRAIVPPHEFLPVFGGYPAAPWGGTTKKLPPQEVYAFRFGSRVSGNMGVIGAGKTTGGKEAATDAKATPFLTAEIGGGIEDTYARRPVVNADDIAAIAPVMLGSGVNGYGIYMMVGGEDPKGKLTTLEESQATGYPTDVPVKSYDFQAPIGQFGRERQSLRLLKEWNYFMDDFGPLLAPMPAFAPAVRPSNLADLSVLRWSVRTNGRAGFVSVNNYVRGAKMPSRPDTQFAVKLPGRRILRIPAAPVNLPSGVYFAWPFGLNLDGLPLRYGTAQLVTRLRGAKEGADGDTFVFACVRGVRCELVLEGTHLEVRAPVAFKVERRAGATFITRQTEAPADSAIDVKSQSGKDVRLLLLSPNQAVDTWKVPDGNSERLLQTKADVIADKSAVSLRQLNDPHFAFSFYPKPSTPPTARVPVHPGPTGGFTAEVDPAKVALNLKRVRAAGDMPSVKIGPSLNWRPIGTAEAPSNAVWQSDAAEWSLRIQSRKIPRGLANVFLYIQYTGDEARLLAGGKLLDDNFFNGEVWRVGLRRFAKDGLVPPLTLKVLPIHADAPIYLSPEARAQMRTVGQTAWLYNATAMPQYQIQLTSPRPPVTSKP